METIAEINIKGMVCDRCIFTVRQAFLSSGYPISYISLGKVVFSLPIKKDEKAKIKVILSEYGFDLISDKQEQLLIDLKISIEEWTNGEDNIQKKTKLSDFLSNRFNRSYDALSEFFVRLEGTTIEKYFIGKRIEKVKELLVYTDKSLSEIAYATGYSSVHHLSSQFKKITGFNPSELRKLRNQK